MWRRFKDLTKEKQIKCIAIQPESKEWTKREIENMAEEFTKETKGGTMVDSVTLLIVEN